MREIRVIEGYTRDLGLPDLPEGWEIYNACRPFPCHKDWTGEFLGGVFYGAIDPGCEFADGYRKRADELDAARLVFVTRAEVEDWGRQFCKERGLDYDSFEYEPVVRSYLNSCRREDENA